MYNLLSAQVQVGNFWDSKSWGLITVLAVLLLSLLLANVLKSKIKFLQKSLIPTSCIGGIIVLIVSFCYTMIVGKDEAGNYQNLFNTQVFGGNGLNTLYLITYHCLAIGFIASTLKRVEKKSDNKERVRDIFNSGVHTVLGYLLQGVLGLGITLILAATVFPDLFPASGLILPFGFGQGTGQALNWGTVYESKGFVGGANFGLTVAALGFLAASIGGVIYMHVAKRKNKDKLEEMGEKYQLSDFVSENEFPSSDSMDKMTVQIGLILLCYVLSYLIMWGLSSLIPSLTETLYGFNFLIGALMAVALKAAMNGLKKKNVIKREYINNHLMTRITGFAFDVMIVAGFAAIELQLLASYWHVLLLLAVVGTLATYFYCKFICDKLFPAYKDERFLAMYGMLTGTASNGMILLHEIDPEYKTPAANNLVYQQVPAICFGFPLMFLAPIAPDKPYLVLGIVIAMFILLNIILFRSKIFKRKKPAENK